MIEVKTHRLARIRRRDPLVFGWSAHGRPVLRRWQYGRDGQPANASAVEDLPAGETVIVDAAGGIYEIRRK